MNFIVASLFPAAEGIFLRRRTQAMKENSMSEAMEEKTGAAAPETGVKAADAGQEIR